MSMKYKAVIYDWDGCLLQSLPVWIEAYKRTLGKAGCSVSSEQIIKLLGNWEASSILGHPDLKQATDEILEYVHQHIGQAELYPHAITALKTFKEKGFKVFLITSTFKATTQVTTVFRQIEEYIDYAVFADDVTHHKPHPESINLIIDKFDFSKNEIVMIGDSDKDILAAKNAGIDCLWFAPSENQTIHDYDYLASLEPLDKLTDHADVVKLFSYMPALRVHPSL